MGRTGTALQTGGPRHWMVRPCPDPRLLGSELASLRVATQWGFFPLGGGYCLTVDALVLPAQGHSL
jgi:hypothetical protein